MQTVSLGLGLEMHHLDYLVDKGHNNFRALNYPKVTKDTLDAGIRGGAHTDYGTFTLLFQDNSGGLEVINHQTGEYQKAPPLEDSCIVNCGDMMERITN